MSSAAENALSKIQSHYREAELQFAHIESLEAQIDALKGDYNKCRDGEHVDKTVTMGWDSGETTIDHTSEQKVDSAAGFKADIKIDESEVKSAEGKIEELYPDDHTLENMFSALNGLNLGKNTETGGTGAYLGGTTDDGTTDTGAKVTHELMKMINLQIQNDELEAEGTHSSGVSSATELKVIQNESLENSDYQTLAKELDAALTSFDKAKNSAKGAADGISGVSLFFNGLFGDHSKEEKANDIHNENTAKRMIAAVMAAKRDLASVTADMIGRAFQSAAFALQNLEVDAQKILSNPKLSSDAKAKKLAGVIQLMLGFLQVMIQTAENLRSKDKQEMSKATIKGQKLNIDNVEENNKILMKIQKQEHTMGILHKVLEGVEITASAIMAATGNVGVAIAIIAITVLSATGTLSKWTKDLGNDFGGSSGDKLGADALMIGITTLATMGGSVAIDMMVEKIAATMVRMATNAAMQASQSAIDDAVNDVMNDVQDTIMADVKTSVEKDFADETPRRLAARVRLSQRFALSEARDNATVAIENTAKKSAEMATKGTTQALYKRSVLSLAKSVFKDGGIKTFGSSLSQAIKRKMPELIVKKLSLEISEQIEGVVASTVKDAVETSIKDSTAIATKAALEGSSAALEKDAAEVASKAATRSVQQAMRTSDEIQPRFKTRQNLKAGAWAGAYSLGSTNALCDVVQMLSTSSWKKKHKGVEEALKVAMNLIQELIEMVAMLKGGGFGSQMASDNPSLVSGAMMKAGAIGQGGGTLGDSILDLLQEKLERNKANAEMQISLDQAGNQLLHTMRELDKDDTSHVASGFTQEIRQLAKSQLDLSNQMWEGLNAGAQMIAARNV